MRVLQKIADLAASSSPFSRLVELRYYCFQIRMSTVSILKLSPPTLILLGKTSEKEYPRTETVLHPIRPQLHPPDPIRHPPHPHRRLRNRKDRPSQRPWLSRYYTRSRAHSGPSSFHSSTIPFICQLCNSGEINSWTGNDTVEIGAQTALANRKTVLLPTPMQQLENEFSLRLWDLPLVLR